MGVDFQVGARYCLVFFTEIIKILDLYAYLECLLQAGVQKEIFTHFNVWFLKQQH